MTPMVKSAAAIAAAIVFGLVTITLFVGRGASVGGPQGSATPHPTVSSSAGAQSASPAAISCDQDTAGCAGPLDPGVHSTTQFTPAITYTTPAGWENTLDVPTGDFRLVARSASPFPEINVWSNTAVPRMTETCPQTRVAGVGDSVQEWKTFVTQNPALAASTPVPVTIGGHDGFSVRFVVAPTWTPPCDAADAFVEYVAGAPGDGTSWGIARDAKEGIYLTVLDVGGDTVVIGVNITDSPQFQDLVINAAQPVIDSMRFTPGG